MPKATLHSLFSPDLNDPQIDKPTDPENFMVRIQALIGIEGDDTFVFYVCTPKYLSDMLAKEKYVLGIHYLIVPHYDFDLIKNAINEIVKKAPDGEWKTQAEYIAQYGEWEFAHV